MAVSWECSCLSGGGNERDQAKPCKHILSSWLDLTGVTYSWSPIGQRRSHGQAQSQGRKCTATHDEATARTWMQAGGMNWSQWLNPPQGTTPYIWSYLPHHLHHQPKESSCLLKPLFHQLLNQWVAGYFCLPLPPSLPLPSSKSCLGKKISFAFPSFRIWAKKPCDGQILQQT